MVKSGVGSDLVRVKGTYSNAEGLVQYRRSVSPYSMDRYKNLDLVVRDGVLGLSSPTEASINIRVDGGQLYYVEPRFKNRLDLIAYEFYGNAKLTWVIMHVNNITTPLDIPVGTALVIPPLSALFGAGGILL